MALEDENEDENNKRINSDEDLFGNEEPIPDSAVLYGYHAKSLLG